MNIVIAILLILTVLASLILIPAMKLSGKISRIEEVQRMKEKEVQEDG